MEVEEPERNSAMQTADRLGSRRGKQLSEGSGPGKSTQHPSEVGRQGVRESGLNRSLRWLREIKSGGTFSLELP